MKSGHYISEWGQVEGVEKWEELAVSAKKELFSEVEQRLLHFDERNTKKIWTQKHFFLTCINESCLWAEMCIKQVNKVNFDFMLTLIKTDPTALSNSSYFAVHKPICGYNTEFRVILLYNAIHEKMSTHGHSRGPPPSPERLRIGKF